MTFREQLTNPELFIDTRPRTYIKWVNTEEGRDRTDCFERVDSGGTIIYVNTNNRYSSVIQGHPFFDKLEELYHELLLKDFKTI